MVFITLGITKFDSSTTTKNYKAKTSDYHLDAFLELVKKGVYILPCTIPCLQRQGFPFLMSEASSLFVNNIYIQLGEITRIETIHIQMLPWLAPTAS